MAQPLRSLEVEALKLPEKERARLAKSLLFSLPGTVSAEEDWERMAELRYREMKEGSVEAIPSEEVFRRARARRT